MSGMGYIFLGFSGKMKLLEKTTSGWFSFWVNYIWNFRKILELKKIFSWALFLKFFKLQLKKKKCQFFFTLVKIFQEWELEVENFFWLLNFLSSEILKIILKVKNFFKFENLLIFLKRIFFVNCKDFIFYSGNY